MVFVMLGNGYDIDCGLPTKYTQFLKICDCCREIDRQKLTNSREFADLVRSVLQQYADCTMDTTDYIAILTELFRTQGAMPSAFFDLVQTNRWIYAFIQQYRRMSQKGVNWVDFEADIAESVQFIRKELDAQSDSTQDWEVDLKKDGILFDFFSMREDAELPFPHTIKVFEEEKCLLSDGNNSEFHEFQEIIEKGITQELEKLNAAFEMYLDFYVNNIACNPCSSSLSGIDADYVISFNYTNTYERLHPGDHAQFCYIHGKATQIPDSDYRKNHIVLGIDDYLSDEESMRDIVFIKVKKFYQRIFKGTGAEYRQWLQQLEILGQEHELYIFGHSLAVTDKDVIREMLTNGHLKTIVFYYSESSLSAIIINLVQILGRETLIQMAFSSNPRIRFIKQQ